MWPVLVVLLPLACSRPAELRTDDTAPPDPHQVPFRESESKTGNSAADISTAAQGNGAKAPSGLPFGESQDLPAGTLLTVRLKSPISADNPGSSGTFDAILDEPVLVEGSTLLPRGASVAGRVESASASQLKRNRGYVRLTLDEIDVAGRELPIQTISLFVHGDAGRGQGTAGGASVQVVRLESGRRLTFRLTESVSLADPSAMPSR